MIETSGVIEKEQGNGFYLVTLEQPAGHSACAGRQESSPSFGSNCWRATRCWWKSAPMTSPEDGSPTGSAMLDPQAGVQVETVPVAHAVAELQAGTSSCSIASLNTLRCFTPRHCCTMALLWNSCTVGVPFTPACSAMA